MHIVKAIGSCVAVLAIAGCATAPTLPLDRPLPGQQAEVIVFRESAFAAGGVPLTVGLDGKAFANVSNGDKVRANVVAGSHEVFVQARSAEPSKVRFTVAAGATVCLRTSSSPSTYAKVIVPIALIVTGYHFYLDELPCPTNEELAKYKDTRVEYR
jgi:hypothetical protein